MTFSVAAVAVAVVLAAAVRSTWSPCGLSMLSTITPVAERAKGHAYRSTAAWFIVGASVGGATIGAVMGLLAALVGSLHPSATALELSALAATAVAAVSDSGVAGVRVPIHRRQVNERWLDHYRPWVYGAGFGWQIGTGITTYITTAAVYLMIVLGALTADPLAALALGMLFGLLRGLAVLLTRRLTSPADLIDFHRRFAAAGVKVGHAVVVTEFAAIGVLTAVLWSPSAVFLLVVLVAGAALAGAVLTRRARSAKPSDLTTDPASEQPWVAHTTGWP